MSESLGLASHPSSCTCADCGMFRAVVCLNCAEALILESGPGEIAVEPCSGACREAIELYFSTPPERWRAPFTWKEALCVTGSLPPRGRWIS